jgi:uncharacterized lipoprotein NlpE involved in copper resistance
MKQPLFIALIISTLISSCVEKSATTSTPPPTKIQNDTIRNLSDQNAQNSLDWAGVYKGTTPCADCEGIETELTLKSDNTYILKTKYLRRKGATENTVDGRFSWDSTGNIVILSGISSGPNQYKVSEGYVKQLDMAGSEITGDLAGRYILRKI